MHKLLQTESLIEQGEDDLERTLELANKLPHLWATANEQARREPGDRVRSIRGGLDARLRRSSYEHRSVGLVLWDSLGALLKAGCRLVERTERQHLEGRLGVRDGITCAFGVI